MPTFVWATRPAHPTGPVAGAIPRLRPTPERAARDFLARVAPYYDLDEDDIRRAPLRHVHDTGQGGIIVSLYQEVDGIEVFRDELKVLLGRDLEPIAVAGSIPGKIEQDRPEARVFRLDVTEAIGLALDDFAEAPVSRSAIDRVGAGAGGYETHALRAQGTQAALALQPIRSKRVFFRLPSALVPAYYVEVANEAEMMAYVVSGVDGVVLFRHSLMNSDAFSYRVWADNTSPHAPFDGPQGNDPTPNPFGIPNIYIPPFVPSDLLTLECGPISTNDPWLAPNATETNGNNVDAYVDLFAPDGLTAGDFRASKFGANLFDYIYQHHLEPGADISQQKAATTQAFYTTNFLHDWFYDAGFNEASRNAQTSNYGRGGVEGDNLRVEVQDYAGFNNANMSTPADGGHPRMQMFKWGLPNLSFTVNSPPSIAGTKTAFERPFNPQVFDVTAEVAPVSQGTFSVTSNSTLPAPAGPQFVTSADLNGDFKADLLSANDSGTISVWLGDGSGGFGARSDFAAGAGTYVAATGDVDGDGDLDVATANYTAGTVSVLLNDGTGVFGSPTAYASGSLTTWVLLRDVSGDFVLDLVSTNYGSNDVVLRLGDGVGGFGSSTAYATGMGPNAVAAGDFNGDGWPDLVTVNASSNSVSLFGAVTGGAFAPKTDYPTGANPLTCAVGDLDHDQKLDVVTADYGAGTISVLRGDGGGGLSAPTAIAAGSGPVTVVLGNLNDDPYTDIAVCRDGSNTVSVLLGDGAGSARLTLNVLTGSQPYGAWIGDFSGDGEPDVVAANHTGNSLTVRKGLATPKTTGCPGPYVNSVVGKIALIDYNGSSCWPTDGTLAAQSQGAVGVILVQNSFFVPGFGSITSIPAMFVSPADGAAIRAAFESGPVSVTMRKFYTGQRDAALDNQMVAHEWGHYLSNRLIGNAAGITTLQSAGMGEGWADFCAMLLTVRPEDASVPSNPSFSGAYSTSGYSFSPLASPGNAYYFGPRRYPYSTEMQRNPLTFKHIQDNTALPAGPPVQANGFPSSAVHNTGEVWCTMLWECYASLLRATSRLTFDQARDRMRQYLVASLKLTPNAPTFVEARDAVLAVAAASDQADFADFFAAFAKRGIGIGAIAPPRTSTNNNGVTESFQGGGDLQVVSATLNDAVHACDGDGVLDEGEVGLLTVTIMNRGSVTLNATTGTLSSTNPAIVFQSGPSITFPPSLPFKTVTAQAVVRCSGASGVQAQDIQILCSDPAILVPNPPRTLAFLERGNVDLVPSTEEHVEAPAPGWSFTGVPIVATVEPWRRRELSFSSHEFYAPDPNFAGDQWLLSPPLPLGPGPFSFTFRHAFAFEAAGGLLFDGGVIEISVDDGAFWEDIGAFISPGYNGTLTTGMNPLGGRQAFAGTSPGFPALQTATVNLGTSYAGQTARIRFRLGADQNTGADGWHVDDLVFTGLTSAPFTDVILDPGPCVPVAADEVVPAELSFALAGANPSRGGSSFRFGLPRATRVTITIHDVAGRQVGRVADGEFAAGFHTATWSAAGATPASGIYFARMVADGRVMHRRVVVLSR